MVGGYKSVADIGSQTRADGSGAKEFYKSIGVDRYVAFDIDGAHGALRHDFNEGPIDEAADWDHFEGRAFDLVVNNGTSEHVFNQAHVFESVHILCAADGVMVHILPWAGWLNHGFFNYQPALFRDLAEANGYAVEALYAGDRDGRMVRLDAPGIDPYKHPKPWKENLTPVEQVISSFGDRANVFIVALLKQGQEKKPFTPPIQGKYKQAYESFAKRPLLRLGTVETDPFPHMIVENVLPQDYYDALVEAWPEPDLISRGSPDDGNVLHQRSAKDVIGQGDIPQLWRQFFMDHTGPQWFEALAATFGPHWTELFQKLPQELSMSIRGTAKSVLTLDCQFAINTPSQKLTFVRGPHIDNPVEILAGLFYMPVPGDKQGGDLCLYRWKGERRLYGKAECHPDDVEYVKTIPYKPNTAIFFVNGPESIHGVTVRQPGPNPRRYINLLLEADRSLFDPPPHVEGEQSFMREAHRR